MTPKKTVLYGAGLGMDVIKDELHSFEVFDDSTGEIDLSSTDNDVEEYEEDITGSKTLKTELKTRGGIKGMVVGAEEQGKGVYLNTNREIALTSSTLDVDSIANVDNNVNTTETVEADFGENTQKTLATINIDLDELKGVNEHGATELRIEALEKNTASLSVGSLEDDNALEKDPTVEFVTNEIPAEEGHKAFSYGATGSLSCSTIFPDEESEAELGGIEKDEYYPKDDKKEIVEDVQDEGSLNFNKGEVTKPVIEETLFNETVDISIIKENEEELLRLQATIKNLRDENSRIDSELEISRQEVIQKEHHLVNTKAENDELKIELSVIKRRHFDEIEDYKNKARLFDKKKMIFEEKIKDFEGRNLSINNKARIDVSKVKQKESELENQLELIKHDSESQVQNRDAKILQLKRKIDTLEFNMENIAITEKKAREDKLNTEDKLHKLLNVLRNSLAVIDDEEILDDEILSKINQLKT